MDTQKGASRERDVMRLSSVAAEALHVAAACDGTPPEAQAALVSVAWPRVQTRVDKARKRAGLELAAADTAD